jgi:phosphoglycolate phosphatase-like HAD superfamily hydrolase
MWDCYGGSMSDLNETEALYYLLSDAETFIDIHTLDDIADEFGYTDYQEIKNVYNGLRDSYNKAIQFFGTEERFCEVLEKLREEYDY